MFDPSIGRWLEMDPIAFDAGDANLYRFGGNNPANLTDQSGLEPIEQVKEKPVLSPLNQLVDLYLNQFTVSTKRDGGGNYPAVNLDTEWQIYSKAFLANPAKALFEARDGKPFTGEIVKGTATLSLEIWRLKDSSKRVDERRVTTSQLGFRSIVLANKTTSKDESEVRDSAGKLQQIITSGFLWVPETNTTVAAKYTVYNARTQGMQDGQTVKLYKLIRGSGPAGTESVCFSKAFGLASTVPYDFYVVPSDTADAILKADYTLVPIKSPADIQTEDLIAFRGTVKATVGGQTEETSRLLHMVKVTDIPKK